MKNNSYCFIGILIITSTLVSISASSMKLYVVNTHKHDSLTHDYFLRSIQDAYETVLQAPNEENATSSCDLILQALQENWQRAFIYSDGTGLFLGSTAPYIERALATQDIVFLLDDPHGTPSLSFFACKGTPATLRLWKTVQNIASSTQSSAQNILKEVLLSNKIPGLAWGYLPIFHFASTTTFGTMTSKASINLTIPGDLRFLQVSDAQLIAGDRFAKYAPYMLDKKIPDPKISHAAAPFDHKKVACISIPKTGTHLLTKLITLLTSHQMHFRYWTKGPYTVERYQVMQEQLGQNHMLQTHAWYTTPLALVLQEQGARCLFIYRDPRDQLVSHAFHIFHNHKKWLANRPLVTLNNILTMLITRGSKRASSLLPPAGPKEFHATTWRFVTLAQEYRHFYLPWIYHDNVYSVQFERLIGLQGGGSQDAQTQEILNIARHIGIPLTRSKAQSLGQKLWGGTSTFRQGSIGAWKTYLTPEHKKLLKQDEEFCALLIELGYEKNTQW